MRRGEVWTAGGGLNYAGKPRPIVVIQDDSFDATASITVCPLTTDTTEAPIFRLLIAPTEQNGLNRESRLMIDKITTIPKSKVGARLGRLGDEDILRINRAAIVFLGLAASTRSAK